MVLTVKRGVHGKLIQMNHQKQWRMEVDRLLNREFRQKWSATKPHNPSGKGNVKKFPKNVGLEEKALKCELLP